MATIKDGGPAFPVHPAAHECGDAECTALSGMTLRDYFAAQYIAGAAADPAVVWVGKGSEVQASHAYRLADAMLAEREKAQP
jgi:hypothetical protein